MMTAKTADNLWSLEVVRGTETGRRFPLNGGTIVLGNALGSERGIDLAAQEGTSPRRMAAKQAQIDCTPQGPLLRDLDSPGGTFVNRQRILPGQARALQPNDLIQLAGVQLKVVAGTASKPVEPLPAPPSSSPSPPSQARPTSARPGELPAVFTLAAGAACRTWDDFLTVAAQRWTALREELTTGRLAAYLTTIGHSDLIPSPQAPGTPDERLDAWLARLPTTRPAQPELDVHPETLVVRASPGGGMARQTIQIANTGYRLLRSTVRVEPVGTTWIKVASELTRTPVVTIERTDLPIEVTMPETLVTPMRAALVIESNGGTKRIEVRLERPPARDTIPEGGPEPSPRLSLGLGELIAKQPTGLRVILGSSVAAGFRLLIALGGMLGSGEPSPALRGPAILLAVLGGVFAAALALRRGEARDLLPSSFAGAFAGVLLATLVVAACRAIEPALGPGLIGTTLVPVALWAVLGAGLAGLSVWLIPYQARGGVSP
jgi:hypothetical protein